MQSLRLPNKPRSRSKTMPIIGGLSYHPTTPRLALPRAKALYPFDKHAYRLILEIVRVGWEVPGWDIGMQCFGTGNDRYISVTEISGHVAGANFYLKFNRLSLSKAANHFQDEISLSQVCIPHVNGRPPFRLVVTDNPDETKLSVYAGDSWDAEYPLFYDGTVSDKWDYVLNSKSEFVQEETWQNTDNGMRARATAGVTYDEGLKAAENLLERIVARVVTLPSRHVDIGLLACPEPDKLAKPIEAYAIIGDSALIRVQAHKRGVVLKPWADYAMLPDRPILPLDLATNTDLPRAAFVKYTWLTLFKPDPSDLENYTIFREGLDEGRLVKVTLKLANDAFVADLEAGLAIKRKFWADHAQLSKEEVSASWLAVARSMVPLDYYTDGKYKKPLLLLTRELGLDEVQLIE
jgi:hypothetical protein